MSSCAVDIVCTTRQVSCGGPDSPHASLEMVVKIIALVSWRARLADDCLRTTEFSNLIESPPDAPARFGVFRWNADSFRLEQAGRADVHRG